ncbi:bifunctional folylpolyglutamate synthase/dihydrofolate synthase [Blautia marasmi]|uniref:bifunctional folylpolyglutamate synthase/dihydrofolate synthase n=1 Tax=Blautia marasmi TaxID=1917868 RepID=UPI000CF2F496|nr:folylpolyglutamate synthase/dihydrofolate synthase family protein [Blautia marasmi]
MNYEEARVYLDEVSKYGSVLGLDNMRELLGRLGNPQDDLKFIHISGTNGKGSALSYMSTILSGAGFRTGRYISPTLYAYRERIQVDGVMIDRESLAALVTVVKEAVDAMEAENKGNPTVFEVETALSFLYFKEQKCDIVVLETGLGGTLDATNVVKTTVMEMISSIGMDHMEFLGGTLQEIAENKAGIIKPHTWVVSAEQDPQAAEVIKRVCREKDCKLSVVDPDAFQDVHYGYEKQTFTYKNWKDVEITLAGTYQVTNAALALEAVEALRKLGYSLTEEQVRKGMKAAFWRGRFSVIHKNPVVVIDGAHNPAAAKVLKDSLETYFQGKNLHFIMGVFADKDYQSVIEMTAPLAKHIITIETPGNPRALSAVKLKEAVEKVNPSVEAAGSIREAVEKSMKNAQKDDVIAAFGSLSFLGELDREVQSMEGE